jgi:entericidin A
MFKKIACILLLLTAAFALTGCNTVEGFGRDVANAGEAIEDAAK